MRAGFISFLLVFSISVSACSSASIESDGSQDEDSAAPTTENAPAESNTTEPPAVDLVATYDTSGEDFEQIYRNLSSVSDAFAADPDAGDPSAFFGPNGGQLFFEWLAERSLRRVADSDTTFSIDSVAVQDRVSEDRVQLIVTSNGSGTIETLDAEDGVVSTDDVDGPSSDLVSLERGGDGRWRLMATDGISFGETSPFFMPTTLLPATDETRLRINTFEIAGPSGEPEELRWQTHGYLLDDGSACVEFRIDERARYPICMSADRVQSIVDESRFSMHLLDVGEFGVQLVPLFAIDSAPSVLVERGESSNVTLKPRTIREGFGVDGALGVHRAERIVGRYQDGESTFTFADELYCGQWARYHTTEESTLAAFGPDSPERSASRDELVEAILQQLDESYFVPTIEMIDGEEPDSFNPAVFVDLPTDPDFLNVLVSDHNRLNEGRTTTWSLALAQDDAGWFIASSALRMDCEAGAD